MNLWQQNYDPAGNIWLSSLIASLPILFFFFALIKLKLKGYVAATWTVLIALSVALLFYKMPVDHALASGFGAPVAITAALLVGLGFNPLYAAGLCLIVNTAPVAFGAMGIPILVAGQVTGLDSFEIGQMVGRQLPFLTIIVLFWIMAIMDGWSCRTLSLRWYRWSV